MSTTRIALLGCVAAFAAPRALAQNSGASGWELITPGAGSVTPSGTFFAHPASTAGCFIVASADASGANSTFSYDPTLRTWAEFAPPLANGALQPLVVTYGGFVLTFGGGLLDDLQTIQVYDSSTGSKGAWTSIQLAAAGPGFGFRNGGRTVLFGSVLYRFGGSNQAGAHNDLWALDLSTALAGGFLNGQSYVGWVQIYGDQATPNYPSPRANFVLDVEGHTIVLFGGFAGGSTYNNELWFFEPSNFQGAIGPVPNNFANSWFQASAVAANARDGVPSPRGNSAHGIYGDNLFIFGGVTSVANVDTTVNDLWINHLPTATWFLVTPAAGQPWPQPQAGTRVGALMIGRWFYAMVVTNQGVPGGSQLWRWTFPAYPQGGGGGGGGGGSSSNEMSSTGMAIAYGHTGGIVIGILIGLANLYLLYILVQASPQAFDFKSTKLSATATGFYTGTSASSAATSAGYVAPRVAIA